MKKALLLSISTLVIAGLQAQITITSADIGQAGDSMIVGNVEPDSVMNVGGTASQTWDFEFLVDDYNTLVFENPANTASSSQFPNADMAIERQSDTLFFKLDANEFALDGLSGDVSNQLGVPITLALNIPGDVTQIEFPSTYGDNFTDQATIDTIINCADVGAQQYCTQARLKRRILITSEIDAYGALETSGGSYGQTLRQYFKERTIDSVWANLPVVGGPMNFIDAIDSTVHNYRWYANGEKWPVLSVVADGAGGDILAAEFQIDNLLGFVDATVEPACNGDCNGIAVVGGLGADPPYNYQWPASAGSQTTAQANGLCAGSYLVTITDNDTNTYELLVEIDEPTLVQVSGSIQGVNFENDGAIDITPSGGTGSYTYAWTGPDGFTASSQDISGLAEGDYTVVVSDDNDCDTSKTFSVLSTGIDDATGLVVKAFPNPANQFITLQSDRQLGRVVVKDLLGNEVMDMVVNASESNIDVSSLSNGVYLLELRDGHTSHLHKITIQR